MASALRAELNPMIVSLALTNAVITVSRHYVDPESEEAENIRQNNSQNTNSQVLEYYKTTITDIKPNINDFSLEMIIKLMKDPETLVLKTAEIKKAKPTLLD